jgi:hypothetical protein
MMESLAFLFAFAGVAMAQHHYFNILSDRLDNIQDHLAALRLDLLDHIADTHRHGQTTQGQGSRVRPEE